MNKRLKIILIITWILILLGIKNVFAVNGSFSINKNSIAINVGETATFSITATNCAGKFTITSSNTGVVTVNTSSEWIENASKEVTLTAKSVGTAIITIKPDDVSSTDENEITRSKTIQVTVTEKATGNNNNSNSSGETTTPSTNTNASTTTTTQKSTEAVLRNLGITPNDFKGFKQNIYEYTHEVPNSVDEITVYATALKGTITSGTGKVSLKEGENTIKVVVTAEAGNTKTYTLTIKRRTAEEEKTTDSDEQNQESKKTSEITDKGNSKFGLTTLEVKGFLLSPEFETDIYEYKLELNQDLSELDIQTIATHDDTTIEIIGNENLQLGENTITILVRNQKKDETATYQILINKELETAEIVEKKSWLNPSTWGREEIIKIIIITVLIILIIIAIILKIKIAKENKKVEDIDFPGGDELDKALAEHQELSETAEFMAEFNMEDGEKYNENQNKEENEYSENYIEDIAKSKNFDVDFQAEKTKKRKGKHF